MTSDILVETHGLSKRFGDRLAVSDVDLSIQRGVAVGLLGPNGAGKTTLMRTLLGLTRATAGRAILDGHRIPEEHAAALARVGAVVEEPRFHNHLTGAENMRIVAALLSDAAMQRIPAVLDRVGLGARADDRVGTYSQGMRQRLGIARCLLNDPVLLILDEPMNGLDPAGIQEMRVLIRSFVDEGRTVLLSSHLLDEIEKTCDAIAILDRGRLIRQGSLAQVNDQTSTRIAVHCNDPAAARRALQGFSAAPVISDGGHGRLLITVADDAAVALINRTLVLAGVDVTRLEPVRVSLEERFLDITTRLDETSERTA